MWMVSQEGMIHLWYLLWKPSEILLEHWLDKFQEQEHVLHQNHAGQEEEDVVVSSEEDQEEWCVLLGAELNSPKCANYVTQE